MSISPSSINAPSASPSQTGAPKPSFGKTITLQKPVSLKSADNFEKKAAEKPATTEKQVSAILENVDDKTKKSNPELKAKLQAAFKTTQDVQAKLEADFQANVRKTLGLSEKENLNDPVVMEKAIKAAKPEQQQEVVTHSMNYISSIGKPMEALFASLDDTSKVAVEKAFEKTAAKLLQ